MRHALIKGTQDIRHVRPWIHAFAHSPSPIGWEKAGMRVSLEDCALKFSNLRVSASCVSSRRRARELRRDATWAERRLWRLLRSRRLAGYKFRRQEPRGPYILDFYSAEARVAVELDGFGHGHPDRQESDRIRDQYLQAHGILVKRFWNHQFVDCAGRQAVAENLWQILQARAPHPENLPLPPPRREPDPTINGPPSP
jgi:very-short-patch-repair endonuclease